MDACGSGQVLGQALAVHLKAANIDIFRISLVIPLQSLLFHCPGSLYRALECQLTCTADAQGGISTVRFGTDLTSSPDQQRTVQTRRAENLQKTVADVQTAFSQSFNIEDEAPFFTIHFPRKSERTSYPSSLYK